MPISLKGNKNNNIKDETLRKTTGGAFSTRLSRFSTPLYQQGPAVSAYWCSSSRKGTCTSIY